MTSRRSYPVRRGRLILGAALTISEVRSCRRALQRLLRPRVGHPGASIDARIDAHALRTLDTAGLQLLLAAGRHARQHGGRLALEGAAELVRGAAASLGLDDMLGTVLELTA